MEVVPQVELRTNHNREMTVSKLVLSLLLTTYESYNFNIFDDIMRQIRRVCGQDIHMKPVRAKIQQSLSDEIRM